MKDLYEIPKQYRTPAILEMGLRKNGCELKCLDADELTEELVHIAVEQNGLVYDKVPEQYKTKELLRKAIVSSGGMVVSEYLSMQDFDEDLQFVIVNLGFGYVYHIGNLTQAVFDYVFEADCNMMMYDFVSRTSVDVYQQMVRKFMQHRHIIFYFEKHKELLVSNHVRYLHCFTNNVSMNLMLRICEVAPNTYSYFQTVDGFVAAQRNKTIDAVLADLE